MPRTAITIQTLTPNAGVASAAFQAVDAVNGMQVPTGKHGTLILQVKNTDTVNHTVTVLEGKGTAKGDLQVTVPANTGDVLIGPLDHDRFEQTDENFYLDFDSATGMTIKAIRLP